MIWPVSLLVLPLALLIDRLIGDPRGLWSRLPHPVVMIGGLIASLDARGNDLALSFRARRARGAVSIIVLVLCAATAGLLISFLLSYLPLLWRLGIEAILVSVLFAQKSMVDHVLAVWRSLASEGPEASRRTVAEIVGRDVSELGKAGIARAAIESAAENFSDALVAPVFWYALLGLPGLLVFKTVSTADSMIGHRSPRYEAFGWTAARLDDLLCFVPARLSALLLGAAALLTGRNAGSALRSAWRDARLHKSPNAGWPEAATAGALGIALGGPRRYGEQEIDGAWLNPRGRRDMRRSDVRDSTRLIDAAWAIIVAVAALIALAIALW